MEDDDWDLYAVVRSCKTVTTTKASTTSTTPNPVHYDGSEPSWIWDWVKREEAVETHIPPAGFSNLESSAVNAFYGLEEFYQPFLPSPTVDDTTTTTATSNYAPAGSIIPNSTTSFISNFGGGSTSSGQQQLQQQQNNFLPANTKSPHFNPGFTPVSGIGRFPEQHLLKQPKLEKSENPEEVVPMLKPVAFVGPSMPTLQVPAHLIRPRKRKSPVKKMVCHLTAENLSSSDLWAWRKYGQKPIKGSPHPRNYYRCSSSKGCSARKQVERSNEDPNMFVVTYCGDHTHPRPTHRNSLAGSTRTKAAFTTTSKLPESSPPVQLLPAAQGGGDDHDDEQGAANNNSGDGDKASEEAEDEEIEEDEEDEEFVVSSEEDIFLGMKQLGRTGSGGSTLVSLAAGASGDGFSTKQSNLGSSWGAGCSSSAEATVSGGC
ncbi:hypothetical protein ACLB2K_075697 [Fragaria x ananassa]